jgi:acyl carrier protein
MDQATVLQRMKAYFEGTAPRETLDRFEDVKAMELFEESIDVLNFLFYLEDEFGPKIDATQVGPAMATRTFAELSAELTRLLNDEPRAAS